ncbi:hypothetical protein NP493_182g02044 [Ridgeia piscesae]|uniref:Uncharacterized protein n=1 Tax=Ridgeia piscesae TaxID=27915 RepID=A0AAD9P2H8_RIDPI|nr:hypothetical protein NP493_182g02044 [Ridgeia piscesae]
MFPLQPWSCDLQMVGSVSRHKRTLRAFQLSGSECSRWSHNHLSDAIGCRIGAGLHVEVRLGVRIRFWQDINYVSSIIHIYSVLFYLVTVFVVATSVRRRSDVVVFKLVLL